MRHSAHPLIETLESRIQLASTAHFFVAANRSGKPTVWEYTQAGAVVRKITFPTPGDYGIRDLVVDDAGRLQAFNGTFNPYVTTYANGAFDNHTTPDWTTANNTSYGGIATDGRYIYIGDGETANDDVSGILRFDTANSYAVTRFADGVQALDVTMGLDGKLYALQNFGPPVIHVFDPATMTELKAVTAPWVDLRSATADADGNIYAGEWGGDLYKLDPDGNVLTKIHLSGGVSDLDFSPDGTLLARAGNAANLYDTDLNLIRSVPISSGELGDAFVAWAPPVATPPPGGLTPTPTPTVPAGTVTGNVFADNNATGRRDNGDGALANWRVFVDANDNGTFDAGEKSALTDAAGAFSIAGVPAGTHRLRTVVKPGYRQTLPAKKSFITVKLGSGVGVAAGAFMATDRAQLTGMVFRDADGDGQHDKGDKGIKNVTVFLDANDDGVYDKGDTLALTDKRGLYLFNAVAPGTWVIRTVRKPSLKRSGPAGGKFRLTFAAAQLISGKNFGYHPA